MAGHIDVRVKVAASLDVLWEISKAVEMAQATAGPADRHAVGHEMVEFNRDRNSVIYRINPGTDTADRTWEYQVERIVNETDKTAYARRWGNENFLYSYAYWQYTGANGSSELRCVADFELAPGAPMDDRQMEAFMSRGTRAAMEKTARAAEAGSTAASPG